MALKVIASYGATYRLCHQNTRAPNLTKMFFPIDKSVNNNPFTALKLF